MAWSQTLLSPLVKSCYTIQRKSKFFSLPMSPLYVLPLFGRVRGCVASFGKGQSPLPLPADTGRIWAAVPPFRRNAYSGHVPPPNRFARDEKKSRIKTGVAGGSSGRSLRPAVRVVTGLCGVSKVGSKTGSGDHVCGHNPRTPTAITKK